MFTYFNTNHGFVSRVFTTYLVSGTAVAFHKIIRVGIIRYFMLGIIFELNFIHKVYFIAYSLKFNESYYLSFGYDE